MNSRSAPHFQLPENASDSGMPGALGWMLYRFGLIGGGILWVTVASTLCGCTQTNGWVMNQSGRAYYNRGNYTAARYEFERALMDNPYNASYAYNVARAMEKQGDVAGAEQMYQHAIQLDPSHQPSYHAMSTMLASQGRESEAHGLLQAWAATQPYASGSQAELAQFEGATGMASSGSMGGMMSVGAAQQPMASGAMAAMPSQMAMDPHSQPMVMASHSQPMAIGNPYQQVSMSRPQGAAVSGGSAALQMAANMSEVDPSFAGGPLTRPYSPPQMTGMPSQQWGTPTASVGQANPVPLNGMPPVAWNAADGAVPQQFSAAPAGPMLPAPAMAASGQPVELGQPQPLTQVVPNTSYPMMSNVPMIQAF